MSRESNNQFVARKRVDSPAVNFLSFMAGLICALTLLLMAISYFNSSPSGKSADAKQDPDSSSVDSRPLPTKDFESTLSNGSIEELEQLVVQMNGWDRRADVSVRFEENRNRARAAEAMLKLPLSPSQRELAANSKIEALSAIYGMDFLYERKSPTAGPDLRSAAETFRQDSNQKIAQTAKLAIVKVDAFEFIKNGSVGDLQPTLDQIIALLREDPNNEFLIANIRLIVISLFQFDRESALKLMRNLEAVGPEFESSKASSLFLFLSDQIRLAKSDISGLFENRWVNGQAGQRELRKTTIHLAADPAGGLEVLNMIDQVASWFEQDNQYENAQQIYQALLDSAEHRQNVEVALAAQKFGRNGLTRCQLAGKKLEFKAKLDSGDTLTSNDLENRIVVVIFFSLEDQGSVSDLNAFHGKCADFNGKQITVLAYCVDDKFDSSIQTLRRRIPGFMLLINQPAETGYPTLLQQCPVSKLPHALLIDHLGRVDDVNVSMDELKTATQYLANRRFDSH